MVRKLANNAALLINLHRLTFQPDFVLFVSFVFQSNVSLGQWPQVQDLPPRRICSSAIQSEFTGEVTIWSPA